jgi:hypothetical protein
LRTSDITGVSIAPTFNKDLIKWTLIKYKDEVGITDTSDDYVLKSYSGYYLASSPLKYGFDKMPVFLSASKANLATTSESIRWKIAPLKTDKFKISVSIGIYKDWVITADVGRESVFFANEPSYGYVWDIVHFEVSCHYSMEFDISDEFHPFNCCKGGSCNGNYKEVIKVHNGENDIYTFVYSDVMQKQIYIWNTSSG